MPSTNFVVISSKYRTEDSRSTTDFTYSIGSALEVYAVAIKSVSIPNVQYNINKTNNTLCIYKNSNSIQTITIPEGQYDIESFIDALQTHISLAISDTVTITHSCLTGKLTIAMESSSIKFSIDPILSPLSKGIGLGSAVGKFYPTIESLSMTCPNLHNLAGLKNYYLSSRVLSQGFNGVFKNGINIPLVMNIPVDVPYGVCEHYDPQDIQLNLKRFNREQNIQWIDIKIVDEDLNVVDLHGSDIEIVIKIYKKDQIPKN